MSLLSENIATVVSCDYLSAGTITTTEFVSQSIVTDMVTANVVKLVDPVDPAQYSTLTANGTNLDIVADTVSVSNDLTVTGELHLTNPLYKTQVVTITTPGLTQQLTFTQGLLTNYQ
jgi:hypothetical protein